MPSEPTGDPKSHPTSKFSNGISGECLCGSIKVTITDSELFSKQRGHLCHCANCRKVSGSIASANLLIEKDKVQVEDKDGTLKSYEDDETLSGALLERHFCGRCGCPIYTLNPDYEGKIICKMGMFPRIPQPEAEGFSAHRHDWMGNHPGVTQYKTKVFAEKMDD